MQLLESPSESQVEEYQERSRADTLRWNNVIIKWLELPVKTVGENGHQQRKTEASLREIYI